MTRRTLPTFLALLLVVAASAPSLASVCEFDEIAIFATNSIRLGTGVTVTGNVVANNDSAGPFLDEGVELALDRSATVDGDATAFSVDLDNGASVSGALTCEIGDASCTGLAPPVFEAGEIPAFLPASIDPGAEDVFVGTDEIKILPHAPSYGDIVVAQGGTLVFPGGGRFDVRSITSTSTAGPCDPCRAILFTHPTELRIEGRFDSERGAYVGPEADSTIDASDIVIHVGGQNGATGGLFEVPRAANVGRESTVHATFYVPNGTFEFEKSSTMSGAVLAQDVQIDKDSEITVASAFANDPPSADPKDVTTDGQMSVAIVLSGSDPEGEPLTFAVTSLPTAGSLTDSLGDPVVVGQALPSPTVTYAPTDPAAATPDGFGYEAIDSCGATGAATVVINNAGDPTVPPDDPTTEVVANDQVCFSTDPVDCELETIENTAITILLTGAAPCDPTGAANPALPCDGIGDDAPLTFSVPSTTVQGGTLSDLAQGTDVPRRSASVLYSPPANFTGIDSFSFDVSGDVDGSGDIDPSAEPNPEIDEGNIEISVQVFTPAPPVQVRDKRVSTEENQPIEISLGGGGAEECRFDSDCEAGEICNDDGVCEPEPASLTAGPAIAQPSSAGLFSSSEEQIAERQALAKSLAGRSLEAGPQAATGEQFAAALDLDTAEVASSTIAGDPSASDVLSSFGVIGPTRGSSLVVLSTGTVGAQAEPGTDLGTGGTAGDETVLTLVLNVPAGNGLLSFDYNFLSAEHPDFVPSVFNDTFTVTLTDSGGTRVIESAEVNFAALLDVTSANAGGTGFDLFTADPSGVDTVFVPEGPGVFADAGLTGYLSAIEPFVSNGEITLQFSIKDLGDGILDSAVVLDNVSVEVQQIGYTVLSLPQGVDPEDGVFKVLGTLSYIDPVSAGSVTITQVPVLLPTEKVTYTPPAGKTGDPLASFEYQLCDEASCDQAFIELVVNVASQPVDACLAVGRPADCSTGIDGQAQEAPSAESDSADEVAGGPGSGRQPSLVVIVEGEANGSVSSSRRETRTGSLPGLSCDTRCGADFAVGEEVVLFARPIGDDSAFSHWSGDCSGSEPITTVTVGRETVCRAVFEASR